MGPDPWSVAGEEGLCGVMEVSEGIFSRFIRGPWPVKKGCAASPLRRCRQEPLQRIPSEWTCPGSLAVRKPRGAMWGKLNWEGGGRAAT